MPADIVPQVVAGRGSTGLDSKTAPKCYSVVGGVQLAAGTPQGVNLNTGQQAGTPADIRSVTLDNTANNSSVQLVADSGDVMYAGPNQCATRSLMVDRGDLRLTLTSKGGGTVGLILYTVDLPPAVVTAP